MPKFSSKKFVLVSIEDDGDTKQALRRLRRYLTNHKMKYITASNAKDMKDHLDKLQNNCLVFPENVDTEEEFDYTTNAGKTIITTSATSTHQEALEQWAREAFSGGSEELQLLFGASTGDQEEPKQDIIHEEKQDIMREKNSDSSPILETEIPQLFTLNSIEPDDGLENGKDEGQDIVNCLVCECQVGVGRNRNTKIKRQAQHVIDNHVADGFRGVQISKRYQCLQCYRTLPVSKSPCEHISEHHVRNDMDTEFLDLWNKDQLSSFNIVLGRCFNRLLPVPRSRRFRSDKADVSSSYRILQRDEVGKVRTEKDHVETCPQNANEASTSARRDSFLSNDDYEMRNGLYEIDSEQVETDSSDFGDHCYSLKPMQDPDTFHQL